MAGIQYQDISPDQPSGSKENYANHPGIMLQVDGSPEALYAVSNSAGIWKTSVGSPWSQLPRSPRRAYCIATDPSDVNHVAVGERAGESADPANNTSGVWESLDGGFSWT